MHWARNVVYYRKKFVERLFEGRKDMFFVGSMLAVLIIPLVLIFAFGIPVLLAVLVYRDANKRIDCTPWLWALVAALVPSFIGAIVYLIIRRDYPLKPEYQMYSHERVHPQYSADPSQTAYREEGQTGAYETWPSEKKGMPTWAKALIIIGLVVFAIAVIGIITSVIHSIINYAGYDYYGNHHYGF